MKYSRCWLLLMFMHTQEWRKLLSFGQAEWIEDSDCTMYNMLSMLPCLYIIIVIHEHEGNKQVMR